MPQFRCSVCGTMHYVSLSNGSAHRIKLTARQESILASLRKAIRDTQRERKVAYPKEIAPAVGLHPRTIRRELNTLEQLEEVERPYGPRSGWQLVEIEVRKLQQVA